MHIIIEKEKISLEWKEQDRHPIINYDEIMILAGKTPADFFIEGEDYIISYKSPDNEIDGTMRQNDAIDLKDGMTFLITKVNLEVEV